MVLDAELTNLSRMTFSVIDFETTGSNPAGDRITEAGMVKVRAGEVLATMGCLVRQDVSIPTRITSLTGITNSMLRSGVEEDEMVSALYEQIIGTVIVGHNVGFDLGFLTASLERVGLPVPEFRRIDTLRLARKLLAGEVCNFQLGTLANYLRTPHQPSHRALDDALATVDVLHALIERAASFGCTHIDELEQLGRIDLSISGAKLSMTTRLPHSPGVYLFCDRSGTPIYIGKATDLKARVRSYFHNEPRKKVPRMLGEVGSIEAMVFGTELEAHLAEIRLIRKLKPKYNKVGMAPERYLHVSASRNGPTSIRSASTLDRSTIGPIRTSSQARRCLEALRFRIGPDGTFNFEPASIHSEKGIAELVKLALCDMQSLATQQRFEAAESRRAATATLMRIALRQNRLYQLVGSGSIDLTFPGGKVELTDGIPRALRPRWRSPGAPEVPGPPEYGLSSMSMDELCVIIQHVERTSPMLKLDPVSTALIDAIEVFTPTGGEADPSYLEAD